MDGKKYYRQCIAKCIKGDDKTKCETWMEFWKACDIPQTQEEARLFIQGYMDSEGVDLDTVRVNIGYAFDNPGMSKDRQKFWIDACGAYHPYFPAGIPNHIEEAYAQGREKRAGDGQNCERENYKI